MKDGPTLKRLHAQASQLSKSKRHDLAEPILRRVLEIDPDNAAAHRQLASCLRRLRRGDEALQHAKLAVSLAPDSDAALAILAIILKHCGFHDEAVDTYEQALQKNPANLGALIGLAGAYLTKKQWEEALETSNRGLAIKPDLVGLLRVRATASAALGKTDDAILDSMEFLRLAPDDADSHSVAGAIMKGMDRPQEALEFARRALSMNPASPEYHNSLAQLKLKARQFEDAHRHFSEAAGIYDSRKEGQKGSSDVEIKSLLGQAAVNLRKHNMQLAESQYRRVLEIDPQHGMALAMYGATIGSQQRFEEGLQICREAVERFPSLLVAKRMLSVVHLMMEKYEDATAIIQTTLEELDKSAISLSILCAIHLESDEFAAALDIADRAVAINPSPEINAKRAIALAGLGRRDEAVAYIESMPETEPVYPGLQELYGRAFAVSNEWERAEFHFQRANKLDPAGIFCLGWIGLAMKKQGKVAEALPILRKSLTLNPHQRRVRAALKELGET